MILLMSFLALAALTGIAGTVHLLLTDGYRRVPTDRARIPDRARSEPVASESAATRVHAQKSRDVNLGVELPRAVGRTL